MSRFAGNLMKSPFQIKICGVTTPADALAAAAAGADAIGLNFYAQSPRFVSRETAAKIRESIPNGVCCVGVFVDASVSEIADALQGHVLDAVQFHGDESPENLAEFRAASGRMAEIPLIRAFRCQDNDYAAMALYLDRCQALDVRIAAILIDAHVQGKYGGAGQPINWSAFREAQQLMRHAPLVLAGGLRPHNIAAAIIEAQPHAVDVASGVESQPGRKDPEAMKLFVSNAKSAFASLPTEP